MKLFRLPLVSILLITCFSFVNHSKTINKKAAGTYLIDYTGGTAVNECTGETVTFSGSMLLVVNTVSSSGGFHSKTLAKPQDLSFVSNGETFRAVGMTLLSTSNSTEPASVEVSGINNMLFIGETSKTKYMLNEGGSYDLSFADGSISNLVYHRSLRCQ